MLGRDRRHGLIRIDRDSIVDRLSGDIADLPGEKKWKYAVHKVIADIAIRVALELARG